MIPGKHLTFSPLTQKLKTTAEPLEFRFYISFNDSASECLSKNIIKFIWSKLKVRDFYFSNFLQDFVSSQPTDLRAAVSVLSIQHQRLLENLH